MTTGRLPTSGGRAPAHLRWLAPPHLTAARQDASRFLANRASHTPLLPDADRVCFVDIDDTVKATHGHAKQGVGYGVSAVEGLNALIAVVFHTDLRAGDHRGQAAQGCDQLRPGRGRFVAEGVANARAAGAGGLVITRLDPRSTTPPWSPPRGQAGARFSITARMDKAPQAAITSIDEASWTPIRYPNAIWEESEQRWISDAEVAEIDYTAFTSRRKPDHVDGRLIVRRMKRLNPKSVGQGQGELFAAYRHHAIFTDSPLQMLQAETCQRGHAIIEQGHDDLKSGPLAHLPSASFAANSAWLVCAAIAFNLTRAAGILASTFHARATTATIRRQLIAVPARIARSAGRIVVHLPRDWPWEHPWTELFSHAWGPPAATH